MTHTILLIDEVATILRLSKSSVYRMNAQGILRPISIRGGKLRFLASDVEALLQSQSNTTPLVNPTTSAKERKRERQAYQERQRRAEAALEKHRINRKVKGGQES